MSALGKRTHASATEPVNKRTCVRIGTLSVNTDTDIVSATAAVKAVVNVTRNELRQLLIAANKAHSQVNHHDPLRDLAIALNLPENSSPHSVEQAYLTTFNVFEALEKIRTNETSSACVTAMEQLVGILSNWEDCLKRVADIREKWRAYKSKRVTGDDTTIGALIAAIYKKAIGSQFVPHPNIAPASSYVVQQVLNKTVDNLGDYWPGLSQVNPWVHGNTLLHAPSACYAFKGGHQIVWSYWDRLLQKHEVTSPYEAVLFWLLFESMRNMGGYEAQLLIEFLTAAGHKEQLVEYLRTHADNSYGVPEDGYFCHAPAAPKKILKLCENLTQWPDAAYHCHYKQMEGGRPLFDIIDFKCVYSFHPTSHVPVNRVLRPAGNPYP